MHPNGGCGNVDVDHIFVPSFFGYIHAIAIIIALVNVTPTQHNKLGLVLTCDQSSLSVTLSFASWMVRVCYHVFVLAWLPSLMVIHKCSDVQLFHGDCMKWDQKEEHP